MKKFLKEAWEKSSTIDKISLIFAVFVLGFNTIALLINLKVK